MIWRYKMKVYTISRSYPDLHGSNIVCMCSEKIRAEKILLMLEEGGIDNTSPYKIEEHEVME
jgi:hypothetical protein